MDRRAHWERVYASHRSSEVSWYQPEPEPSLRQLRQAGLSQASSVIDIGGGDSRLVDRLLAEGLRSVTVLDVSETALDRARARLGPAAAHVTWIRADVVSDEWTIPPVDFWHDRAVFHFLTEPDDRRRYVARMLAAVKPGGYIVLAPFAADGPTRCSGLPVVRYSADTLAATLGAPFQLEHSEIEDHHTPAGGIQRFQWCAFAGAFP